MVDITAAVLGSLFGVTAILLIFLWARLNTVTPQTRTWEEWFSNFRAQSPTVNLVGVLSGLIPTFVALAGPIIDTINQSFQYSKATLVGLSGIIATSIFGSDKFASLSSTITGILPSIRSQTPEGVVTTSWFGILSWIVILGLVATPTIVTASMNTMTGLGYGLSSGLGALLFIVLLAGNGFLGETTPAFGPKYPTTPTVSSNIQINPICDLPWYSNFEVTVAPASVILTMTILACHLIESWDTKSDWTSLGIATAIILFSQLMTSWNAYCFKNLKYGAGSFVIAIALGFLYGSIGYFTMKQFGQETFTSSEQQSGVFHPAQTSKKTTPSGKTETKIVVGPQPETSEPVDDQDQFVCEAYKDGELITSTIVD